MKIRTIIGALAIGLLSSFTTKIQDGGTDLCKSFFPLNEGTIVKYENFNANDKLQSTDKLEIKSIAEVGSVLTIEIAGSATDKKGKESYSNEFTYTCEDGVFSMDMESIIDHSMTEGMEGIDMEVTSTGLKFPSDLSVGAELPDAEMVMTTNGMEMMKFDIVDRKVLAIETIVTPAGSFECYKISTTTKSKVAFMNITVSSIDWVAENIGVVRSENYNKSGKLESYRVLSEIMH